MSRKRAIALCIAAALVIAAVCLLPLPTRVNRTLGGVRVDGDSLLAEGLQFSADGWYFNYLLREDRFKGTITYDKTGGAVAAETELALQRLQGSEVSYAVGTYYNAEKNQMDRTTFYIFGKFDKVCVFGSYQAGGQYFPAATAEEAAAIRDELPVAID